MVELAAGQRAAQGIAARSRHLASIARAADQEIARERQAEEAARQQQVDAGLLDDSFGKSPAPGNGGIATVHPVPIDELFEHRVKFADTPPLPALDRSSQRDKTASFDDCVNAGYASA